jgi:cell division protein FtsI (penicillin-binding protein 3)/stage V sporulation protein D (sporulation-specific penicillin-binding protein)
MKSLRINFIFFLTLIFGLIIIARLYFLQVIKGDYYQALAQGQQKVIKTASGERGRIFFKSGQVLATNERGKFLYVSPLKIKDKEGTTKLLSEVLNLAESEIREKIEKENYFELIKKRVTKEEIESLKNLEGVYFGETNFRNYPQAELASHLVGFLNEDGEGQYGLEGYYDQILRGKEKLQENLRTPWGYLTAFAQEEPERGRDIFLTIDYNIQFRAEKLLEEAKEELNIEAGQIIVIEPQTGKILALADFPHFDPNRYREYANEKKSEIFQNAAIQKIYEPGSVLKPITMAAAINEGKVTPETTYIDSGYVRIGGYTIRNWQNQVWGEASMTKVLEKSINTGAVFVEQQLGDELFLEYLKRFGFFEKTGMDLEGELLSENKEFKKGYKINFATASFGQGIAITPLQLVRAFCAIANGGRLVRSYVVEKSSIETQREEVISQETARQVIEMMVSVVEQGYGKRAKIPGYYIAGKTGTAQVPWSALGINRSGYSEKTIHSFVGFGPVFEPKFLISVKLDNPQGVIGSAVSATKIFQRLAKYIIDYWQIPPDYEEINE